MIIIIVHKVFIDAKKNFINFELPENKYWKNTLLLEIAFKV